MKRTGVLLNLVVALLWIFAGLIPLVTGVQFKLLGVIPVNAYICLGIGFLWLVALIAIMIRQTRGPLGPTD